MPLNSPASTATIHAPHQQAHSASHPSQPLPSTTTVTTHSVSHPPPWKRSIKHIPKPARSTCARTLTDLLNATVASPENPAHWLAILDFGFDALRCPVRGGKRQNLTSTILKRLKGVPAANDVAQPPPRGRRTDAESLRAAAVTAKVEEGNITAAVRILCSDDTPADFTHEVYLQLKDKHPAASDGPILHPPPDSFVAYQATEGEVMRAIRSFPAGSAPGSDGLRPQHLLELVTSRDTGPALLTATTAFVNMLLDGTCHPVYRHVVFGGQTNRSS
jgi:hypothetical protein